MFITQNCKNKLLKLLISSDSDRCFLKRFGMENVEVKSSLNPFLNCGFPCVFHQVKSLSKPSQNTFNYMLFHSFPLLNWKKLCNSKWEKFFHFLHKFYVEKVSLHWKLSSFEVFCYSSKDIEFKWFRKGFYGFPNEFCKIVNEGYWQK